MHSCVQGLGPRPIRSSRFRSTPAASGQSAAASQWAITGKEISMRQDQINGIVDIRSNHSVDETVDKLKAILHAKGVTLFALVDHSGEAEKVGMKMRPTKLLIFGNPKAGTPL